MVKCRYLYSLLLLTFLIPFSCAELEVGLISEDIDPTIGLDLNIGSRITNITIINTNHSNTTNYWVTTNGTLGTFNTTQMRNVGGTLNILVSWLSSFGNGLWCQLTGCNMTGNLNVTGNIEGTNFTLNETTINDWDDIGSNVSINFGANETNTSGSVIPFLLTNEGVLKMEAVTAGGEIWEQDIDEIKNAKGDTLNFTGDMFLSGNASVNDLNVRSGASITFGNVPDFIATMTAQSISIPLIGERNVLATDANSFGNSYNYDGTGTVTSLNNNDSEFAIATIQAINSLGHATACLKFGINYSDPELGICGNNFGNFKITTRNDNQTDMSFSFYDDTNRSILGDVFNYVNVTDVIVLENKLATIPFLTTFNYNVNFTNETTFEKNASFNQNITVADTGFFGFIGSVINRITKGWFSAIDVEGDINQTNGNATINLIYGGLANYSSAGWTFPINAAGIYYNVTNLSITKLNGFSSNNNDQSNGGSQLVVQIAGTYELSGKINFEDGANNLYGGGIAINGVIDRDFYGRASTLTANAYGNIVITPNVIELEVGDTINLQLEDETNPPTNAVIHNLALYARRVGE